MNGDRRKPAGNEIDYLKRDHEELKGSRTGGYLEYLGRGPGAPYGGDGKRVIKRSLISLHNIG